MAPPKPKAAIREIHQLRRQRFLEFTASQRRRRWLRRPLDDHEEELFRKLEEWVALGASLSAACMNSDVPESKFAAMVDELRAGRNSEFSERLQKLLLVPWHWSDINGRAVPYSAGSTICDIACTLVRWSD